MTTAAAAKTTVSLLTPPGAGALGVVRLRGPGAVQLLDGVFVPAGNKPLNPAAVDRPRYGQLIDGGETIDDAVVTCGLAESVPSVDIACHGGVRTLERVLAMFQRRGALLTGSSEASLWEPRNLLEQEALNELALARTLQAARFLAYQRLHLTRELAEIVDLASRDAERAYRRLTAARAGFTAARTLLEGATVALVGPPNSGKSTLFNYLVGQEAVLVSNTPGTTRDWVSETIELAGAPVTLVDTAGRRESADPLELEAMAVGAAESRKADVQVIVLDGSAPLPDSTAAPLPQYPDQTRRVWVASKSDLPAAWETDALSNREILPLSAVTGAGVAALRHRLRTCLGLPKDDLLHPTLFTSRQIAVIDRMVSDLEAGPHQAWTRLQAELLAGQSPDICR